MMSACKLVVLLSLFCWAVMGHPNGVIAVSFETNPHAHVQLEGFLVRDGFVGYVPVLARDVVEWDETQEISASASTRANTRYTFSRPHDMVQVDAENNPTGDPVDISVFTTALQDFLDGGFGDQGIVITKYALVPYTIPMKGKSLHTLFSESRHIVHHSEYEYILYLAAVTPYAPVALQSVTIQRTADVLPIIEDLREKEKIAQEKDPSSPEHSKWIGLYVLNLCIKFNDDLTRAAHREAHETYDLDRLRFVALDAFKVNERQKFERIGHVTFHVQYAKDPRPDAGEILVIAGTFGIYEGDCVFEEVNIDGRMISNALSYQMNAAPSRLLHIMVNDPQYHAIVLINVGKEMRAKYREPTLIQFRTSPLFGGAAATVRIGAVPGQHKIFAIQEVRVAPPKTKALSVSRNYMYHDKPAEYDYHSSIVDDNSNGEHWNRFLVGGVLGGSAVVVVVLVFCIGLACGLGIYSSFCSKKGIGEK
eukprot:129382_1